MRYFLLFISVLTCNVFASNTLTLLTDRSKASGEIRVYLKNIGEVDQIVLTRNLSYWETDGKVSISPETHVLIKDGGQIMLKEDLAFLGAVTLRPGETTYINRPVIDIQSGIIEYRVRNKWGTMHGVWSGSIETSF